MTNYAIIKPDGSINHITDALVQAEFDATQLDMVCVQVPGDIAILDVLNRGSYDGQSLTLRDKSNQVITAQTIHDVRLRRNLMLAMSDWTQLPDVPQSVQTAWRPYRQTLRDIPLQADPLNAEWPIAP